MGVFPVKYNVSLNEMYIDRSVDKEKGHILLSSEEDMTFFLWLNGCIRPLQVIRLFLSGLPVPAGSGCGSSGTADNLYWSG